MKILELTLASGFVEELKHFYTEKLGFTEIPALAGENKLSFTIRVGHSQLSFVPGEEKARYHFAFNIPPNKFDHAIHWLSKLKIEILEEHRGQGVTVLFPNWKARSLYFYDPAGNIVELIAREAIPASHDEGFNISMISGVSEIGAAFDDVDAVRQWLESMHGLPQFVRQQNSSEFSALGTDEGLLLLVPEGRRWFMGNFDAHKWPTALVIGKDAGGTVSLVWNS